MLISYFTSSIIFFPSTSLGLQRALLSVCQQQFFNCIEMFSRRAVVAFFSILIAFLMPIKAPSTLRRSLVQSLSRFCGEDEDNSGVVPLAFCLVVSHLAAVYQHAEEILTFILHVE